MYDHITLKVKNVDASARFYKEALAPLGLVLASQDESGAGFGPPNAPALWLAKSSERANVHIAFRAKDQAEVGRFYERALASGGRDNGGPGIRADYSPTYYAAFVLDPDGNNIEAVFTG